MKASDKICVATHQIFDYDLDIQEVGHNGAEEYIRKEALLEWAKVMHGIYLKRYEGSTCTCGEHWGQMVAFQRMIDKLNSM